MIDEDGPMLGVGFAIDFHDSFGQLRSLDSLVGSTQANIFREFQKMEAAAKGALDLGSAKAQITTFGNVATRELANVARTNAQVEKSGELLVRQLERQNSTFGKSKDELREMKVLTAAVGAEQAGMTELAERLINEEIALQGKMGFAAEAAAEVRVAAAARARDAELDSIRAVNNQLAERAQLEAAIGRNTGVDRIRATDAGATFSALAEQAAEDEARALREAAAAYQLFEGRVREGVAAMKEATQQEAALAAGANALRAQLDPMFLAQQRFNTAMDQAETLYNAGVISQNEFTAAQRHAREVLQQHAQAVAGSGAAMNDMSGALAKTSGTARNFALQFSQVGQQVMAGTGLIQALAIQLPDIAAGMNANAESSGKFAALLGGPWGIAATAAIGLAASFAVKLLDTDDAAKKSERAQRSFAEVLGDSTSSWEEVTKAAADYAAQQEKNRRTTLDEIETEAASTASKLRQAAAIREKLQADLEAYEAIARRGATSEANDFARQGAMSRADFLRNEWIPKNLAAIQSLSKAADEVGIKAAAAIAEINVDPAAKIRAGYDELEKQAKLRYKSVHELTERLTELGIAEQAALKRIGDGARSSSSFSQRGRNIDLAEARSIAESVGGRITSAVRDYATQKQYYEKYLAYKEGRGPWAALAAKPGTSNHELGQALDIAKGEGVTLKKLVDAYRAAGVTLTEYLDEGNHYHIAWKKVGDAAKLQSAAIAETRRAAQEAKKSRDNEFALWKRGEDQLAQFASDFSADYQKQWDEFNAGVGRTLTFRQESDLADQAAQARELQDQLSFVADKWDLIASNAQLAGRGMADAFGDAGRAMGDLSTIFAAYQADQARAVTEREAGLAVAKTQGAIDRANATYALRTTHSQIGLFGDMTDAAKGFFKEHSAGYKAMEAAEKAFRAIEFALSVQAMIQNALETAGVVANSAVKATAEGTVGIAKQSQLPFPFNIVAMGATAAALLVAGVSVIGSLGGGKNTLPKSNDGTGTVLGDASAKSESIKRSIDALKEVDTTMLTYSREMAASLRSIEDQIGGFASLVLRTGDVNANGNVSQGFKPNAIGSVLGSIPIVGGILKGLFGTKTKVIGSGLFGDAQTLGDILGSGFDASYYSDVQKKKKLFGITTSTKYKTTFSEADAGLENQFTLILKQFDDAILAAAGPLGESTDAIKNKLNGFVVDIGKIDLQGLTGSEIEEKLSAVFGAAADKMATAAFPGIERFQKAGEGLFETLVRVSSTVESVTSSLGLLSSSAVGMSVDMKVALANQFDSVGDFTSAIGAYFDAYYSKEEQAAAKTRQFAEVFSGLGLALPATLAGFRALVEAQDLTTAAGQSTYATLLQLAPAFADLQTSMNGAKSAADILSEQQDLQRQLLELQGDTAAIRALDLAKIDPSNRALQQQVWAVQDAKKAADAAEQLRQAWTSVGDGIMDEVRRIRGLTDGSAAGSFTSLMGQFNAATALARGGDQDAAGKLVGLSQSLLSVAGDTATSRQELERVKAQVAASLEGTYALIGAITGSSNPATTVATLSAAATATQANSGSSADNDNLADELRALRATVDQMRAENNSGHAGTAAQAGRAGKVLEDVTAESGGTAISVAAGA
jgi:flagellar hook-basal body complex protein FliE